MKVDRLYFDGANKGRIVAVAENGAEFERHQEPCKECGCLAEVMTPIANAGRATKKCCCNHK